MAIYVVEDLIEAIERCEQAGFTYFNMATSQKNYVASEKYDIPTLAKRINDALNANIDAVKGIDGKNVTDISINESGILINYEFNGELTSAFFPDIVQAIPHSVDDIKVNQSGELEEHANGTVTVKGVVIGYDANKPTMMVVNADGTLTITYSDGSTEIVGNIDNFGEDPIESVDVIDGNLYMTKSGVQTLVGKIRGDQGVSGLEVESVGITQIETTYYLTATLSSGYTMTCGVLPEEFYSPNAGAPLIVTLEENGDLSVTLWNNEVIVVGNVNSPIEGAVGDVVATYEFRENGTQLFFTLTNSTEEIFVGLPKQIAITAASKINSVSINDSNRLVFTLDVTGDGSQLAPVILGEVRRYGKDGKGIRNILIGENGDITVSYFNGEKIVDTVIGNIRFNRPTAAYRDQFGFTTIENEKGDKIIAGSADGENGSAGLFVREATHDEANEYMMSFTFSDDSTIADIGKARPLKSHNVSVVDGELIFTLDNGTNVNLGRVSGLDGRDITGAGLVNNQIQVEYDLSTVETVSGSIATIASIDYDEVNKQLVFTYDNEAVHNIPHIRYDGVNGKWVTSLAIANGELVVTYNDLSTDNVGKVDAEWITGFIKVGTELYVKWDHLETNTLIGNITDYDGQDAKYITAMNKTSTGDLEVIWNDTSKTNVGKMDGRWITQLYREGDNFYATFSDNTVATLIGSIESFDGDAAQWITSLAPNENDDLIATFNDGSTTNLGPINGADGVWITSITVDGDDITFNMSNNTVINRQVPGLNGTNGRIITGMTINAERNLEVTFQDETVEIVGPVDAIDYQNGINGIEYVDGYINVSNRVNGVDQTVSVMPVDRIVSASVPDTDLEITTYLGVMPAGRVAGADVPDGAYITKTFIRDGSLWAALSDETEINAGIITSNDMASVEVVPNDVEGLFDLLITMDDATIYRFENVIGKDNNEHVVDAYIDIDGTLILTRSSLGSVNAGQVMGDEGVGVQSMSIDTEGYLVVTLTDSTEARVAYIMRSFGFGAWKPGVTYNRDKTVVYNGRSYVAINTNTDSVPSLANPDWLPIRFKDEPGPEIAAPKGLTPGNGDVVNNLRPYLYGGPERPYYSVDHRVNRIYEIDLASGKFNPPLYSVSENLDGHQAEIDLEEGVEYQWRCRDFLNTGSFSDWAFSRTFTVTEGTIGLPIISVGEGEDPQAVNEAVVMDSTPYSGPNTHVSSDWQVKRASDDKILYEEFNSDDLTQTAVPFGHLIENTIHKMRVRHHDNEGLSSAWSDWVEFKTLAPFDFDLKPVISFDGLDINATVARPKFVASSPFPEIFTNYMMGKGLQAIWEIEQFVNGEWVQNHVDVNMVDILTFRPLENMESGTLHRIRVKYQASRFSTDSEWSDWVEFTPEWSVGAISIEPVSFDAETEILVLSASPFIAENDEYRMTIWEVFDGNNTRIFYYESDELEHVNIDVSEFVDVSTSTFKLSHVSWYSGTHVTYFTAADIWSIDTPEVSYIGDINNVKYFDRFYSSNFASAIDTHEATEWMILDGEQVVYSHTSTNVNELYWDVQLSTDDRDKDFDIQVRHIGKYSKSEWSDKLNFRIVDDGFLLAEGGILVLSTGGVLRNNSEQW